MSINFGLTWDYRCPFARIIHEHVVAGLRAGADWEVDFLPFSLTQTHVEDGEPDVWEDPSKAADLIAMEAALVVRDRLPERFLDVHSAFFNARHEQGRDLRDDATVREVLSAAGVDADEVMAEVADGWPRETFRKAHEAAAREHDVWGVPTFVVGEHAAFVRLMNRPDDDPSRSIATVERIVDAVGGWPELNELKHTSLDR
jgi:hypothetical protein